MNIPMVLVPVHDRIKNSKSLTTNINGFTTMDVSRACDNGNNGVKDASSRSIIL